MSEYYNNIATLEQRWEDIKPYAEKCLDQNDLVLDIGCAEGLLTDEIAKLIKPGTICAVEKNKNIDWLAKSENIIQHHCDILNFKIKKGFDVIFCLGVLHKLLALSRQKLYVKLFESEARVIFIRTPKLEPFFLDIAWANDYSIFQKISKYHGQGSIYVCNKVSVEY